MIRELKMYFDFNKKAINSDFVVKIYRDGFSSTSKFKIVVETINKAPGILGEVEVFEDNEQRRDTRYFDILKQIEDGS